jgi:hypothetical protein
VFTLRKFGAILKFKFLGTFFGKRPILKGILQDFYAINGSNSIKNLRINT